VPVDPPRVELPSAGEAYRLAAPGEITCYYLAAGSKADNVTGSKDASLHSRDDVNGNSNKSTSAMMMSNRTGAKQQQQKQQHSIPPSPHIGVVAIDFIVQSINFLLSRQLYRLETMRIPGLLCNELLHLLTASFPGQPGSSVRRILVRGVNAPLPPEAKKILSH